MPRSDKTGPEGQGAHFVHCEQFAILEAHGGKVISKEFVEPPQHKPAHHIR